jgi:hypothetical protein
MDPRVRWFEMPVTKQISNMQSLQATTTVLNILMTEKMNMKLSLKSLLQRISLLKAGLTLKKALIKQAKIGQDPQAMPQQPLTTP